jgi:AhpD family alkylhydroperoxidase
MDFKTLKENMKKNNEEMPKPMELLGDLKEEIAMRHLEEKKFVYSGTNIPPKYKALIALAVGIAMDSQSCILNNTKAAKKAGASTDEIMETFAIAKFSKGASAISSSFPALEWLSNNK